MDKDILLRHRNIIEDALIGYGHSIEKEIAKDERMAARCIKATAAEAWLERANKNRSFLEDVEAAIDGIYTLFDEWEMGEDG
jgi:hypothetical protein